MLTTVEWDTSIGWWELVAARAALTPDSQMLLDERGRTVTFGEFRVLAAEVAAGLAAQGVRPGQTVSWQLPTGIEAVVLMAALGRLCVVQNPIIPMLRKAEVGVIVGQLHSDWYIVPGTWRGFDYTALANEIAAEHGCAVIEVPLGGDLALPRADPATLPQYVRSDDVRWVFYTSGTTALPKGIRHTDASALSVSHVAIDAWQIEFGDVFPIAIPVTHVGGIMLVAGQLRLGYVLGLFEGFDPVVTPVAMGRMGATHLGSAVPFFLAYLAAQRANPGERLFPQLKACIAGGAPLPPELHEQVKAELGGRGIINAYGLTECPSPCSVRVTDPEVAFQGSVGRPGRGVEVRVADDGELRFRAPQLFQGYVDASLDAGAFDTDGFFRTGDIGRVDEHGYVHITGRIKDIIIRNAENISAVEVENVLHEHPSIQDVAVVGLPDPKTGERACAVIVLQPGAAPLTLQELGEHCASRGLARQKTPEALDFVAVLPRNSMGKILKHEIRARLLA